MNKNELKSGLEKFTEELRQSLAQIRTGRASPAVLDNVKVDAYGAKLTIKEVGSITVSDPGTLLIIPWDKGLLDSIAKAVRESDLKIDPIVEGDRVRIVFPSLTEERRKEYAKIVAEKVEETRQRMRKVRQEAMKDVDDLFEAKEIGEDKKFSLREEVETIVKEENSVAEDLGDRKAKEIMTV